MPVVIKGWDQIERRMKALPQRVAKRELTSAVRAGANIIGKEARRRAPKGETGKLRRNVYWFKVRARNTRYAVTYGIGVRSQGSYVGKVASYGPKDAYYWHFLEFGTRYQKAQPFLRPAFMTRRLKAVVTLRRRLWQGIEKQLRLMR